MSVKDYYSSYYDNEKKQDETMINRVSTINSMFAEDVKSDKDPLEDTQDINKYELTELKELIARNYYDSKDENNVSGEKGKVLKKSLPGYKMSEDVEQIINSFISCFVLALVTASIGTGWLLYIINNI